MAPSLDPERPRRWHAKTVFVAAAILYARTLGFDWLAWDDGVTALHHPLLHVKGGLARIWTTLEAEQYYPLTFSTFWLEHRLFGPSAAAFHATNVFLHAAGAGLSFWFLMRARLPRGLAFVGALVFAVHPAQVMSVAWISERKTLLSTVLTLTTLLFWCHPQRRRLHVAAAALAFAAALLAKSAVLALPIALLIWDLRTRREALRPALLRLLPFAALSIASILPTWISEQRFLTTADPLSLSARLGNPPRAFAWYVGQTLFPFRLTPMPGRFGVNAPEPAWEIGAALLIGVAVLVWFSRRRRESDPLLGAALFTAPLLPILGFVPYGNLAVASVSDHYLHPALLGAVLLLLPLGHRMLSPRYHLWVAGVLLLLLTGMTLRHQTTFCSTRNFAQSILEHQPHHFAAHFALGDEALHRGDAAEAAHHFRAAALAEPRESEAWLRLAQAEIARGHLDAAAAAYSTGLDHAPDHEPLGLAAGALALGRLERGHAEKLFRAVQSRHPTSVQAAVGLATALRGQGQDEKALLVLREALLTHPTDVPLLVLLAQILSTSETAALRNGAESLALALRAQALHGADDLLISLTVAGCLAEELRFKEAAELLEALAPRLSGKPAAMARDRAAHFRSGKPWREVPRTTR